MDDAINHYAQGVFGGHYPELVVVGEKLYVFWSEATNHGDGLMWRRRYRFNDSDRWSHWSTAAGGMSRLGIDDIQEMVRMRAVCDDERYICMVVGRDIYTYSPPPTTASRLSHFAHYKWFD